MSLVGFKASNHGQQVRRRGPKADVDDRATTPEMFAEIAGRFGGFTLDAAAAAHNTKCPQFFTAEDDGLAQSWAGHRVWCNPPYSDITPWVRKAWSEFLTGKVISIVMLLPANRTEQAWWQQHVEPYRDLAGPCLTVEFLPGRPRFIRRGATAVGPNERPPFGCCLLVWSGEV